MSKAKIKKIVLIVLVAVFVFSGYQLFLETRQYNQAEAEYESLEATYVQKETTETVSTENGEIVAEAEQSPYPKLNIDFAALQTLNPDVLGWLYVEGVGISYPIVQTVDNDYYLDHTVEKQVNSSGAIFMDYKNAADFYDFNTFLYGHNMKNNTMFGALKRYYKEDGVCEQNPYFYIYLPTGEVLKYQIFSYYLTTDTSDSYELVSTEEEYDAYVDKVYRRSAFAENTVTQQYSTMVTLSTCAGASNGNQRFLVHGFCVDEFVNE